MAKKKISTVERLIKTPFSTKNILTTLVAIIGLFYLNLSVFSRESILPVVESKTLSQSQLQNVLGTSISIGDKPKITPGTQKDQLTKYWLNVVTASPNYRDAYLILAVQSFNNHDCANAKWYLEQTTNLDSNNPLLPGLQEKMQTCLQTQE